MVLFSIIGYVPKPFGQNNRRFQTPWLAVFANAALSLPVSLFIKYEYLAQLTVIFNLSSGLLRYITLVVLRYREKNTERPFSIPMGKVGVCLVVVPPFILGLFLLTIQTWKVWIVFGGVVILSSILYYFIYVFNKGYKRIDYI